MEALVAIFGIAAFTVVLITTASAFNGWVISTLWGWFIVPVFHLPLLTVWQAAGIMLFVGAFKDTKYDPDRDERKTTTDFLASVCGKLLILGIGWCLKQWLF